MLGHIFLFLIHFFCLSVKNAHNKSFLCARHKAHDKGGFAERHLPCALRYVLHTVKPLLCASTANNLNPIVYVLNFRSKLQSIMGELTKRWTKL